MARNALASIFGSTEGNGPEFRVNDLPVAGKMHRVCPCEYENPRISCIHRNVPHQEFANQLLGALNRPVRHKSIATFFGNTKTSGRDTGSARFYEQKQFVPVREATLYYGSGL